MSSRNLSAQFSDILAHAADLGVELPPDMPGMARVGGLHVPLSLAQMEVYNEDDPLTEFLGSGGLFLDVPDEKGNVFSVSTRKDDKKREFTVVGPDASYSNSPDEFVDMYRNAKAPHPEERAYNEQTVFENPRILHHLGGRPGQVVANHMDNAVKGEPFHDTSLMDRTGELSPAALTLPSAIVAATNDWHEYQAAKARRQQEGGGQ